MSTIFLVSDTHFGHVGVCKFLCEDKVTKIRPWTNPDEMDEDMVKAWNAIVGPTDKVYHLGDVAFKPAALRIMHRLNGDKVLIKGNHDNLELKEYIKVFRDVRGCHVLEKMLLTHVPIHPESLSRFVVNIHGHLHQRRVMKADKGRQILDPRYHCVSVEHLPNFAPISFDDVRDRIRNEGIVL